MFTDIVGYTALMGENESKAYQLLKKNRQVQKPLIEKHGGKWLKEIGDGVLASFQTITDAVYCAVEIQRKCEAETDLKLRIGIHLGEVIVEEGDVFGDGVNIASRLETMAPAGGIYVSESVYRNIENKKGIRAKFVKEENLKNVKHPIKIYEIDVQASVVVIPDVPTIETASEVKTRPIGWIKPVFIIPLIVLVVLAAYLVYKNVGKNKDTTEISEQENREKSIAVLPFANMSDDPDQEYFSDGLSEELLNLLAKIPELKVIGRTSSFSFKGKNEDLREIGRKLGVSYLLEGSVRKSGDKIRVTAQLINAADGSHLWSDIYDRELEEVFAIQDEIATKVVDQLKISIPGLLERTPVVKNVEAYNLILEANYIAPQPDSFDKQIALVERAIALDSSDARIWAELAKVYHWRWGGNHIDRSERAEKARKASEKAIALDVNNAMGHWVLGKILWAFYWDWENAEKELIIAEELSTEYIGARAELYQSFGRWEEAISAGKQKIEVNPIDPTLWWLLGFIYLNAGDPERAIPNLERALELNPSYPTPWIELGWAYCQLGRFELVLETLNHVQDRENGRLKDLLGRSYYALGNIAESDLFFQELIESDGEVDNSILIARAFARRGEADKCFEWVQKAYDRKHPAMALMKGEAFSEIKELKDPRYEEFLIKMNLPLD
jgi:TolB-like protein/cytochrome c-type biogenesis protein CcmH/NrfG